MDKQSMVLGMLLGGGESGGGGGTTDYTALSHKPQINNVTLTGNKSASDIGLAPDNEMTGATSESNGEKGLVPAPLVEDREKYLRGDGTWSTPTGGRDAEITENITANVEVGGIGSGTTIASGTSLTEFAKKLLVKETAPTVTFTASGSGVKEIGTSVTPTLTLTISSAGTGTPVSIEFYSGSTLLDTQSYVSGTNTYTFTMDPISTTTTVKGVLTYKKSDNTNATVEKTEAYTFVMASYYGAVTTAPTTAGEITALTKSVKNTKAQTATFNLTNQRSCYAYPASFGDLTSIKDANNFEYLGSYTKTSVTVDGTAYNVYTLTDLVTASGFKQVYA